MNTLSFSYFLYNHYKYKTIKINQKINFVKFDDIQLKYKCIRTAMCVCVCVSKSGTSKLIKYLSNEFN